MRIKFLLPGSGSKPIGGFKVVYEYANRFVARGHEVSIIHFGTPFKPRSKTHWLRSNIKYYLIGLKKGYRPDSWFKLDPRVETVWKRSSSNSALSPADVIVATAWETAHVLSTYPLSYGQKFYLIQGKEFWSGSPDSVRLTWHDPSLRKIVISNWLKVELAQEGVQSELVTNGLDHKKFYTEENTQRDKILALYHDLSLKGSSNALDAMCLLRDVYNDSIEYCFFSVHPRPADLPKWIDFVQNPSQEQLRLLYNTSRVFLSPSWSEGWGLTTCEAMMCGAPVVATDIAGHREYCVDRYNCLLTPIQDSEALARRAKELLDDQQLTNFLTRNAIDSMQSFDWDESADRMLEILDQIEEI